jgi:PAS domain S-box-containing protein
MLQMRQATLTIGAVGVKPPWLPRLKWHRLYYLLAAFDLFTVVLSLVLNHQTHSIFARSVEVNQDLGKRLTDYAELAQLAQAVNAPGNDVFDTLDVPGESAKMRAALRAFEEKQAAIYQDVRANEPKFRGTDVDDFEQDFSRLNRAMTGMTDEAELIFSYFADNRPDLAGRRMATMDRKYANVNFALADMRNDVAAIQRENFAQQEEAADDLAKFEYLIAVGILLMISAATVYGHKLAKRVETEARERERYVEELRDAEARTRSIVDTAADGILTFDEHGLIESANASAARMFGGTTEALVGRDVASLVPRLSGEERQPHGLHPAKGGDDPAGMGVRQEIVGRREDGATFPLELAVSQFGLGRRRMFTAIIRDVTDRKRAEEERNQLYARQQDLVRRLLLAQEEERRRIAYEVHDGIAQLAAAAQLHFEAFASHVRPRTVEARKELAQVQELAHQMVRESRQVIAGLRPTALDDFGLPAAIGLEVEALRSKGWQVTYDEGLGTERLPSEVETALYRVAQEALRNVHKHAGSTRVHVSLRRYARVVRLEVRDWGRGFLSNGHLGRDRPGEHVGIAGMQERVALLGGRCLVRSREGAGTRVVAEVNAPTTSERVA